MHLVGDDRAAVAPGRALDRKRLRAVVADRTGRRAVVLDDVELPHCRRDADHVVVAPGGVWVVDVVTCAGELEVRDVGGFFRDEQRLFADGRDRTDALDSLLWQRAAVVALVGDAPAEPPVYSALVVVDADREVVTEPFRIDEHWVCSAEGLGALVAEGLGAEVADGRANDDDGIARIVAALRGDHSARVAVDLTDRVRPVAAVDSLEDLLG